VQNDKKLQGNWGKCEWYVQGGTSDRMGTDKRGSLDANAQGNDIRSKPDGMRGEMAQGDQGLGKTKEGQSAVLQHVSGWPQNGKD